MHKEEKALKWFAIRNLVWDRKYHAIEAIFPEDVVDSKILNLSTKVTNKMKDI